jgi:hypothetical protein
MLEEYEWIPAVPDADLQEMARHLRDDLLFETPYLFDRDEDPAKVFSPDRFEIEIGHHPFAWVTDYCTNRTYRLRFQKILDSEDDWEPAAWLESAYHSWSVDDQHPDERQEVASGSVNLDTSDHPNLGSSMAKVTRTEDASTGLQRNAARIKDIDRTIPKPIVIVIRAEG